MATQAEGYLTRARGRLSDAESALEGWRLDVSISNAIESIEFAAKAAFHILGTEYRREHNFSAEHVAAFIEKVPERAQSSQWPRLLMLSDFWSNLYGRAKYGTENLGVPASDLFKREEAELALSHAREWVVATTVLASHIAAEPRLS